VAEYQRPSTLTEALALAGQGGMTIAAGCTDLLAATRMQSLSGPVLDLTGIAALRGITATAAGWRIGALTTWSDILHADLPPAFDGLKAAAREVGAIQIQNAGTLGGNLCNASPAADGVPALLTLDAVVELGSAAGVRQVPLGTFLRGPRQTDLRSGEVMTAILVPRVTGQGGFLKLGARRYLVISIAMVAGRLTVDGGLVRSAALAVGSCSAVAQRLPAQEAALIGLPVDKAAGHIAAELVGPALAPITDARADADYRAVAAVELLRRLVDQINGRLRHDG
jgi:CO/xanthine dehydrogenase FAD-binding subunit